MPLPPAQSLTTEQMEQVWSALELLGETKQRDTALVHILSHGLRAGEIVQLNETPSSKSLADLDKKIEGITARMTQLAEAIIKIQNHLNNQPKRPSKSRYNKSYYQGYIARIQPLTEENLASRLGVDVETLHSEGVTGV